MNTKNIFKALAFVMLMPMMLLTTSCSSDDAVDSEYTTKKGYALPVTINVTRQGNAGVKAIYNESTRKLSFSTGDQLFVTGRNPQGGNFAGLLTWVSDGTFSGTIITKNEYSGTAEQLLSEANSDWVAADLIPAGYQNYGYLTVYDIGSYNAYLSYSVTKFSALTKKEAVEQFSDEHANEYNNGFALAPRNAICSFTISGLAAEQESQVIFSGPGRNMNRNITTNAEGVATFSLALGSGMRLGDFTLTVGGNAIALPDQALVAGHIYNISRSVAPATPALTLTSPTVGQVIGSDGKNYAYGSLPTGVTAVAKICYVSGSNGLALALTDEGQMDWSTAQTTCAARTPAFTGGTWKLATKDEWDNMISAAGSHTDLRDGFSSVGGTNMLLDCYWSSTECNSDNALLYYFGNGQGYWNDDEKGYGYNVRACLAF